MRALYFGTYDRDHPRNVNAIAAMREAGVDVVERSAAVRGSGIRGTASVLGAEARLLRPRRGDFDLVIVGYPGHFDVPQARRLARRKPLIFDAVLSLEDELVTVRRRFRPRSTAATMLRAVDLRALRLPDLVVCGTDAESRHLQSLGANRVASVFLGTDESLYGHSWAPAYPFTAVHFATGIAGDESADIVRAAAELTDVPTQVFVRGEVAPDDLGIAVAHSGIALGSFRESRAIASAIFDALASGAPLITADTDAVRELLRDEDSAILVPANDPPALARAISRLASDDALRLRIAASGLAVFHAKAARAVLGERWRLLLEELV